MVAVTRIAAITIILILVSSSSHADPLGTAFTYQGQLSQSGRPANADFDFQFALFDSDDFVTGIQVESTVTIQDHPVVDSLFDVELDFGSNVFGTEIVWLEIRVREGASDGPFTTLAPRKKITPVPVAIHAMNVETGAIGSDQLASGAVGSEQIADASVVGGDVNPDQIQLRINSGCAADSAIRVVNSDGNVICDPDSDTVYSADFGLILRDSSFSVDPNTMQLRVTGSCALGSSIRAIGEDGTVTCEDDDASSGASAVQQVVVHADYTRRSTVSGNPYYFGASEFDISITPKMVDSLISIDLDVFGESTSQNTSAILQYALAGGSWTDFDNTAVGQPGHLQLGYFPDTNFDSTPHNTSTSLAKAFNTTDTVSFRLVVYNGGIMYWNGSVNSSNESAPSQIKIIEWEASAFQYTKR